MGNASQQGIAKPKFGMAVQASMPKWHVVLRLAIPRTHLKNGV